MLASWLDGNEVMGIVTWKCQLVYKNNIGGKYKDFVVYYVFIEKLRLRRF